MLRRWREQVNIFLHPRQAVLLRVRRGLKARVIHKQVLACACCPGVAAWEAPISALKSALHDAHWQGANAQVVLSNHFVRYALVPWSGQLSDRQERQAYLRHCFGLAYGEAAGRWDLRMSEPRPDTPSLASGIDLSLLESLHDALRGAGMRSDAIHPHLMLGANRSRRWISRGRVWFVMVEHGRLCLSLLDHGTWKRVRNYPADEDWAGSLEPLLGRESVLSGDTRQDWPVVLYWPESGESPDLPGRKVMLVPGGTPDVLAAGEDQACRLAMWV